MGIDNKIDVKHKIDYRKFTLKISKLRYKGNEPPKELLQQVNKIGRMACVSEDELKNL